MAEVRLWIERHHRRIHPPTFPLPSNLYFCSIGPFENYPAQRWSNGVYDFFQKIPMDRAIILLEDYWLMRPINVGALEAVESFMLSHPDCLRFCLSTDRLNCGNIRDFAKLPGLDVFEALESPYQVSFQASAWNIDKLLTILRSGESPWESELGGSNRLKDFPDYHIYGSRQWPIAYQIMVRGGKFEEDGSWQHPARSLDPADLAAIKAQGWDKPDAA